MRLRVSTASLVLVAALLASSSACLATTRRAAVPTGTMQPDQFLFDRGNEELKKKKWVTAREYFKEVSETYTQSPLRPDAKLAVGDTYLGEGSSEALVLAIAEFNEFLSFYPTHPRADYAQFKIGLGHYRQMRMPQRDQTETREAIREFETFVVKYPNSSLMPEVREHLRESRDRLSQAEFEVGRFYYRIRWYPGAVDRLTTLLKEDPQYTARDGAYYYLGESLIKMKREGEALPLFEKLLKEFEQSEYLDEARKRIDELKTQMAAKAS